MSKEVVINKKFLVNTVLVENVEKCIAKIAVIGLGYVGLPTAALFANRGFQVTGIDINPEIVKKINSCELQTKEPGLDELVVKARQKGCLKAVQPPTNELKEADIIIACVQTPVDSQGNANLSFLQKACQDIANNLTKNKLIIIQSTVPPKTLYTIVLPTLENISGLRCGKDFWLSYCPERLSPGSGLNDLKQNSRLIGAYDSASAILSNALFKTITQGELLITDIPSAEVSKLAENTFRFVNIAFANELALLCKQIGVDVKEVIRLANTHSRVNIHQPGCGAGGPCLTKDSHLLLNSIVASPFKASVIPAAIQMNSDMPRHIAELAFSALNKTGPEVSASKVVVFGTAYKGDVDDSRDSPAKGIIETLKQKNAVVVVFDPNCSESFGALKVNSLQEAVEGADCLIIATEHRQFYDLDLAQIKLLMKEMPIIVDAKRVIDPHKAKAFGFNYITTSCVCQDNNVNVGATRPKKGGHTFL